MYVKLSDVPGAKTGLTNLFGGKRNHSIVIPESMVVAEEACVKNRASKEKKPQHEKGDNLLPCIDNPVAMARELGMTKKEFLEEQKKALQEHEPQKLKQDEEKLSRGVKQVVGEILSRDVIAHQHELHPDYSSSVHHPPAQANLVANTVQPGSSAPSQVVDLNPGIGSRIQIPNQSPTEPYRYGVIRWIGEIPAIQGLVAGIEMVSKYYELKWAFHGLV